MVSHENNEYPERIIEGKVYARICRSTELFEGKGRQIVFPDDQDMQIAVFKKDKALFALSNICPHRHQDKIHEGIIRDGNVTCPVHGWTYRLDSGENIDKMQGIKSLVKFDVFEEHGFVWVEKPDRNAIPVWRRD